MATKKKSAAKAAPKACTVPPLGSLPIPADAEALVEQMVALTTKKPKACPVIPVQIPRAKFGSIFDQVMTGTRLALALHRIEQTRQEDGISTPSELIAWEAFHALASAVDELGHAAGYEPAARMPE